MCSGSKLSLEHTENYCFSNKALTANIADCICSETMESWRTAKTIEAGNREFKHRHSRATDGNRKSNLSFFGVVLLFTTDRKSSS